LSDLSNIQFRSPKPEDGISVWRLIASCPPLDPNSSYCNLLQCTHFSSTSVAAVSGMELLGFVSGYLIPDRPNTLFIWQVAVSETARGCGLASRMLDHILERDICKNVQYLETTITEDNDASWALFERLSKRQKAELLSLPGFDKIQHFDGLHDSECLVRIGPFNL
jgi:L-2,4-diaminobutyric acid acetyltransferase